MLGFLLERGAHALVHHLIRGESKAEKLVKRYIGNSNANTDMTIYEARLDIRELRQWLSNEGIWIDNPPSNMTIRELIEIVDNKIR